VPADRPYPAAFAANAKLVLLKQLSQRQPVHDRRIHLRFTTATRAITGTDRVDGVAISSPTRGDTIIPAGLVVSCIGFDSRPIAGLPFDTDLERVPNAGGRVLDDEGQVVAGQYVTGWIKRGPTGVIGTNKHCALETVSALLDDHHQGLLPPPCGAPFADIVPAWAIDRRGWLRIDEHERTRGRELGRARRKSVHWDELVQVSRTAPEIV
jgi:ferredoxin/flavodoxin---NADP+ reductase